MHGFPTDYVRTNYTIFSDSVVFLFLFSLLLGILKDSTDEYVVRLKVNKHFK